MYFCICKRNEQDVPVLNGLCYTPSQMYEKAKKGIPIASQQVPDEHFIEGDDNYAPVVDIEYRRGIDINDLWNEQMNVHKKFRDATREAQRMQKVATSLNE